MKWKWEYRFEECVRRFAASMTNASGQASGNSRDQSREGDGGSSFNLQRCIMDLFGFAAKSSSSVGGGREGQGGRKPLGGLGKNENESENENGKRKMWLSKLGVGGCAFVRSFVRSFIHFRSQSYIYWTNIYCMHCSFSEAAAVGHSSDWKQCASVITLHCVVRSSYLLDSKGRYVYVYFLLLLLLLFIFHFEPAQLIDGLVLRIRQNTFFPFLLSQRRKEERKKGSMV